MYNSICTAGGNNNLIERLRAYFPFWGGRGGKCIPICSISNNCEIYEVPTIQLRKYNSNIYLYNIYCRCNILYG